MKVQYINPFVTSAFQVFEMVVGETPTRGELTVLPKTFTCDQLNVTIGVTGQIQGSVIYGMTLVTADRIASKMIGTPIKTFDELAASAIAELCNMLGGSALTLLSEAGYTCDLTPPTLIRGSSMQISTLAIPAVVVPVKLTLGDVSITVGLKERK